MSLFKSIGLFGRSFLTYIGLLCSSFSEYMGLFSKSDIPDDERHSLKIDPYIFFVGLFSHV